MDEEPTVYDMSHFLEHRFAMPGEERLLIVATRHEDGTSGDESSAYHQQRARLFHSLEEIDGIGQVEYHESVDSNDPRETGYVWVDLAMAGASVAGSLAGAVSAWVALRSRGKKDTVPAIKMELPGKSLTVSHEISKKERKRLLKEFMRSG